MNKKVWNVLVFPGGMENGLEIQKSLKYCKEIRLFSVSSSAINNAPFSYSNNRVIKDVRTEGWIEDLNQVIQDDKIDLVYPANSLVIDQLSLHRSKINASIVLPSHEIIDLTRSKYKTLAALESLIPIPKIYKTISPEMYFPLFCKPDKGYGSQGARQINSFAEAQSVDLSDHLLQECLTGEEYTVDCLSNHQGQLLFAGARERIRVRMGTSMHAEAVTEALAQKLNDYALKILTQIKITGAWFFQVKADDQGVLKLLEIDVRIAGTMAFYRNKGVNFPLLTIFDHLGFRISVLQNKETLVLDRRLQNCYIFEYDYDTVYVDLDDTLIVHQKINTELITFLYQCINKNKKIILISKSLEADKEGYVKSKKLFHIFDEIHWLREDESKVTYMKKKSAIYIDDSFSQRLDVHSKLGIPTFDVSMIESLLDHRI